MSNHAASRFTIPPTLLIGFVVAVLATLVIGGVNFHSADTRTTAVHAMDRVSLAMRQLNQFHLAIKDAETGQRGYLLTGDARYLAPYESAVPLLQGHMANLKAASTDHLAQQQLVLQLETLYQQKMSELAETIALYKSGNAAQARALVNSGVGQDVMERMGDVMNSLRAQQNTLLATRRQAWVDAAANSNIYSGTGSAVLLLLISLSAYLTAREYRSKAAQSWVSAGLTGLGQRIQGDHRLEDTGARALDYLADYLKASVGAGYVADANGGFSLIGGYALPRERLADKLLQDEGLVGQAARSRQLLHVRNVPSGYLPVSSATGQAAAAELLVAPAIENREVFAVIELGFRIYP